MSRKTRKRSELHADHDLALIILLVVFVVFFIWFAYFYIKLLYQGI